MSDPDRPLSAEARRLLQHSRVIDLRDEADELAHLARVVRLPFPILPSDPLEKQAALLVIALRARDHARRLLDMLSE